LSQEKLDNRIQHNEEFENEFFFGMYFCSPSVAKIHAKPSLRLGRKSSQLVVPVDYVAWNRGAHFVRPCPVALRRNKALHLTAQPSNLRFAACSAGERRDW